MGEFFLFELSDLKPIGQNILFKSNRFSKSGVAMHMTNPGWIPNICGVFFHLFVYMYLRICLLCFFLIFGVHDFFCFWCIEDFVFREVFFMFWASRTVIQLNILHAFIYSFVFCLTWSQLVISTDHLVLMTAIASRKIKITIKTTTLATRVPPVFISKFRISISYNFKCLSAL